MITNDVRSIDGALFEKLVAAGALKLKTVKKEINDLNVFPIPDGDTGDNMYMTINGGIAPMRAEADGALGAKAAALAHGMLLNARGNSGVILSRIFSGIASGLVGADAADPLGFCSALRSGVAEAYSAVARPVEGTVLTVAREGVEYAASRAANADSLAELFEALLAEMRRSLERTPDLLPALAEAGVIDSGGAGLIAIFEGMYAALTGAEIDGGAAEPEAAPAQELDFSKFDENSVMTYGYCTELLLRLQCSKVDIASFDVNVIIDFLNTLGDSIVAFKTGSVVKLHVHTMTPHRVIEFCQRFGEFLTVKIENMTLQHNDTDESFATKKNKKKKRREHKRFAVVTVASGEGITETFRELGADLVIDGGQTHNPSTEDFIEAFDEVNADHVFVLPNNGNIVMAAKQAAEIYTGAAIHVVETKNLGHAYSILSALDLSASSPDVILAAMNEDMCASVTGMVSSSVRSASLNGVDIHLGDYVGFTDKTMLVAGADRVSVFAELGEALGARERSFMIAFMGNGVTAAEKEKIAALAAERFPATEFYAIDGGQDVYDFIMILE